MKNRILSIMSLVIAMGLSQAHADDIKNIEADTVKIKADRDRLQDQIKERNADQQVVVEARKKLHEDQKSGASIDQIKSDKEALEGARQERNKDQKDLVEARRELHNDKKERREDIKERREDKRERREAKREAKREGRKGH